MPVRAVKRGNLWRLEEPNGRISMTSKGKPRDGGGHLSEAKANSQARAINRNLSARDAVMKMKA